MLIVCSSGKRPWISFYSEERVSCSASKSPASSSRVSAMMTIRPRGGALAIGIRYKVLRC